MSSNFLIRLWALGCLFAICLGLDLEQCCIECDPLLYEECKPCQKQCGCPFYNSKMTDCQHCICAYPDLFYGIFKTEGNYWKNKPKKLQRDSNHKGNFRIMNKNDFVLKFKYSRNLKKTSENCQRFYFSRYNLFGLFFLGYFEPRMFQSILQSDSLLRIIFK